MILSHNSNNKAKELSFAYLYFILIILVLSLTKMYTLSKIRFYSCNIFLGGRGGGYYIDYKFMKKDSSFNLDI